MKIKYLLFLTLSSIIISAQIQYGQDIFNPSPQGTESMGSSVAISADGQTVVGGSPNWFHPTFGQNSGRVSVFEMGIDGLWALKGNVIQTNQGVSGLGLAVDLSEDGNTLVVGLPFYSLTNATPKQGSVIVYRYENNGWDQMGQKLYGVAAADRFGSTVSLNGAGTRMATGAWQYDANGVSNTGVARVYDFDEVSQDWVQIGSDIIGVENERLGYCTLSNDGNRLAVSASASSNGSIVTGSVRVYQWSGSDWMQIGSTLYGDNQGDQFGFKMALTNDGSKLAASSREADEDTGYVKVFNYDGTEWVQEGPTLMGLTPGEKFGTSMDLNGDGSLLLVGAPAYANEGYIEQGIARFYELTDGQWAFTENPIANVNPGILNRTGIAVALADAAEYAAVGTEYYHNDEIGSNPGVVQVFGTANLSVNDIENADSSIMLSPTIASNVINLHYGNDLVLKDLAVYNAEGRLMQVKSINGQQFDVSKLSPGVYFMVVMLENDQIQKLKFIKE